MAKLNHWVSELESISAIFKVLELLEEQDEYYEQIKKLQLRALDINDKIIAEISKHWSAEEIENAKKRHFSPEKIVKKEFVIDSFLGKGDR